MASVRKKFTTGDFDKFAYDMLKSQHESLNIKIDIYLW